MASVAVVKPIGMAADLAKKAIDNAADTAKQAVVGETVKGAGK